MGSGGWECYWVEFFKEYRERKKNLVFMLHIVYNLGMKLAHYKNGLCRCNNFGENKTVKSSMMYM